MSAEKRDPPMSAQNRSGAGPETGFDSYQKRLFLFLSVASFFEGYDFIALAQILPNFRADMSVGREVAGQLVTLINFGTIVAYFLVRMADRRGRRPVLTVTIAGYTLTTFLSGLAPNPWVFAAAQMLARIFLIAEYETSMVVASEEFPSNRRGTVVGVIAAFSSIGAIFCAGLVPLLLRSPWGWRSVYFVAIAPLLLLFYLRRGMRETRRFSERTRTDAEPSLFRIWKTPYRRRLLQLGAVWFVAYIAAQNSITFWKDFAVTERGFSDAGVAEAITVAAVVAMPFVFAAGRLLDGIGRRAGSAVIFLVGAVGTFGSYTFRGQLPLTLSLIAGIFAASAFLPALTTFTTELFPTEVRADGFAWANNLVGRWGYVLSPLVVGALAKTEGWGNVIRWTAVFPLLAIALVYALLPETNGKTLEETARIP